MEDESNIYWTKEELHGYFIKSIIMHFHSFDVCSVHIAHSAQCYCRDGKAVEEKSIFFHHIHSGDYAYGFECSMKKTLCARLHGCRSMQWVALILFSLLLFYFNFFLTFFFNFFFHFLFYSIHRQNEKWRIPKDWFYSRVK